MLKYGTAMKIAKVILCSLGITLFSLVFVSLIALQRGHIIEEQQKTIGELEKQQLELHLTLIKYIKVRADENKNKADEQHSEVSQ